MSPPNDDSEPSLAERLHALRVEIDRREAEASAKLPPKLRALMEELRAAELELDGLQARRGQLEALSSRAPWHGLRLLRKEQWKKLLLGLAVGPFVTAGSAYLAACLVRPLPRTADVLLTVGLAFVVYALWGYLAVPEEPVERS